MTKQEVLTWKQYLKNFRIVGCEKCPHAQNESHRCEYGMFFCDKDRREVMKIRKELNTSMTIDNLIEKLNSLGIYDYDHIAEVWRR